MNKFIKKLSIFILTLFLCFLTYKFCYFIAEKFFFDKFFYQKSVAYGYWVPTKASTLYHSDFGDRAKDIYDLETNYPNELLNNQNVYKIAIYGDSYVWGQGVTNNQRFAKILQDKLNKIRPTRVFSLAETGDDLFDHYQKYKLTPQVFGHIDLNIFGIILNDLLFDNPIDNRYGTKDYLQSINYFGCRGPEFSDDFQSTGDKISRSMDPDTKNYCVYKKIISLLPREKTIYFDLSGATYTSDYPDELKFVTLLSQDIPLFHPYPRSVVSLPHPNKYNVSKLDAHPSALANQLYADILYQEITTNPKWGFIKK